MQKAAVDREGIWLIDGSIWVMKFEVFFNVVVTKACKFIIVDNSFFIKECSQGKGVKTMIENLVSFPIFIKFRHNHAPFISNYQK